VAAGESSFHQGPKGQGPFDGRRNNGGDDDAGGGRGGEEESEGEPAEVMEVISELMGGGVDGGSSPNFVTPPPLPLRPLVRAGAQFMCGAVTFAGIGINWLYDILDRLMYFHVPNGWKVLGGKVPPGPAPSMSTSLNGLLQSMSNQNKSIATDRQLSIVNDDEGNVKGELNALLVPSMLAACLLKLGIESIDFRGLEKSIPLLFNMGQGFGQNENGAKVSLNSLMSMPISLMSIQQRLQNLIDEEFLEKGELPSEAIAVALLQQLVPLLEYNAFHSLFPWCYKKTIDEESLQAVNCLFSVNKGDEDPDDGGEGSIGYKRVVLEPRFTVKDASKANDKEKPEVYEHFTQCKALVLIGNLESAPNKGGGGSMQQLLQLGVPVGLDDGARYIAR
jgi:hypothetical protein